MLLVLNLISSPDGKIVISVNSGFLPHALDVFDAKTHKEGPAYRSDIGVAEHGLVLGRTHPVRLRRERVRLGK